MTAWAACSAIYALAPCGLLPAALSSVARAVCHPEATNRALAAMRAGPAAAIAASSVLHRRLSSWRSRGSASTVVRGADCPLTSASRSLGDLSAVMAPPLVSRLVSEVVGRARAAAGSPRHRHGSRAPRRSPGTPSTLVRNDPPL